jgi:hypothetical protein
MFYGLRPSREYSAEHQLRHQRRLCASIPRGESSRTKDWSGKQGTGPCYRFGCCSVNYRPCGMYKTIAVTGPSNKEITSFWGRHDSRPAGIETSTTRSFHDRSEKRFGVKVEVVVRRRRRRRDVAYARVEIDSHGISLQDTNVPVSLTRQATDGVEVSVHGAILRY